MLLTACLILEEELGQLASSVSSVDSVKARFFEVESARGSNTAAFESAKELDGVGEATSC